MILTWGYLKYWEKYMGHRKSHWHKPSIEPRLAPNHLNNGMAMFVINIVLCSWKVCVYKRYKHSECQTRKNTCENTVHCDMNCIFLNLFILILWIGLSLPAFPTPGQQQAGSTGVDPAVAAYQQNLQRAFLQSAMAQNIQIQQQLLAQNQALQQMLVQPPLTTQQQTPVSSDVSLLMFVLLCSLSIRINQTFVHKFMHLVQAWKLINPSHVRNNQY